MTADDQARRRQRILADFGDFALQSDDLDAILTEACRLVAEALGTRRAKVLEIEAGGRSLFLRAGVGWTPGLVGGERIPMGERSSEAYSIAAGRPVIMQDASREERFDLPGFMTKEGVRALANVPVFLPGRRAYGLLQVDDTEPRDFDEEDTEFLRTYGTILGPVIDRLLKLQELRSSEARFGAFVLASNDLVYRMSPDWREMRDLQGRGLLAGLARPGADWMEHYVHPEDRALVQAAIDEAVRTRGLFELEHRVRHSGREAIWVLSRAVPMTDGEGRIVEWLGAARDVTARRAAEEALRESEERFRAIVETATDYAIFTADPEGRIETWPRGAELVFGWTAEEAAGRPMEMTYTPEDVAAGVPARERTQAREAGQAANVRWHRRRDGTRVFIEGIARPLHGPDGRLRGYVKVGQDATERRATLEALRNSEARFRQFGEASADVLWIRDAPSLAFDYVSPAFEEVYGVPLGQVLSGNHLRRWLGTILAEDRGPVLGALRRVRAGERVQHSFRIRCPDGRVRRIRSTDFPLRDEEGRVERIGGISHDATEEIELQDRLRVLLAELQHRTRNLMGVVRSVTDKTLASSRSLPDFRDRIRDRLNALSRVNGLLSRLDGDQRITFDELFETELMAHGVLATGEQPSQVTLEGPEGIPLRSSTVQTLALGLHELATNALKHGALSRPEGRLEVRWALVGTPESGQRLRVDWRESGAGAAGALDGVPAGGLPPDGAVAPGRGGYGRELIERALPYQLGAETAFELTPEGARCTITLPVSPTMGTRSPGDPA